MWALQQWLSPHALKASQMQIATVTHSDFVIKTRDFGRLKSQYQRHLTNSDVVMVEIIHVYPGTIAHKSTVILSLVNSLQV